jgi:predicted lipoprotein
MYKKCRNNVWKIGEKNRVWKLQYKTDCKKVNKKRVQSFLHSKTTDAT